MRRIAIFDTSICSLNVGDEIIMDNVNKHIYEIFNNAIFLRVPTHERLMRGMNKRISNTELGIVGGTNLLSLNMLNLSNQWNINIFDVKNFNNVVFLGVGCNSYNSKTNFYTRMLYKKALSNKYLHSVRDGYTESVMKHIGINNVINTGCPTLWELTEEHCRKIPKSKAKNVVCTFTDYNRNVEKDKELAKILFNNYEKVYFWAQGSEDYEYVKSISDKFIFISPTLKAYDDLLESDEDLDFVGTRLHGGIRAMQKGRRSIIISIDNRAREMGKDYNLNVIERDDIDKLEEYINSSFETNIKLNWDNINKWKNQFK